MARNVVGAIPLTELPITEYFHEFRPINANGLPTVCTQLMFTNNSDSVIHISYDGEKIHEVLLPFETKKTFPGIWPAKTIVYAAIYTFGKRTGHLFLSGYFIG